MPAKKKPTAKEKKLKATVKKLRAELDRVGTKADRWKKRAAMSEASAASSQARVAELEERLASAEPPGGRARASTATKAAPAEKVAPTRTRPDAGWTVVQLRSEARSRGLVGYSSKSKAELLAALK